MDFLIRPQREKQKWLLLLIGHYYLKKGRGDEGGGVDEIDDFNSDYDLCYFVGSYYVAFHLSLFFLILSYLQPSR